MTRKVMPFLAMTVVALAGTLEAASFSVFTDRTSFEAELGATVTDSYDGPGYLGGGIFTDVAMSAVLGETDYEATTFPQTNIVMGGTYCAGCGGSFRLTFTSTSVGTPDGVFGVGFLFAGTTDYSAYVVFGDDSVADVILPLPDPTTLTAFFGLTSMELITSIHVGGLGGQPLQVGFFGIDDLTIGSTAAAGAVPEPASVGLLGAGLLGLGLLRRRRSASL